MKSRAVKGSNFREHNTYSGVPKRRFRTRAAAEKFILRYPRVPRRVYECSLCGDYHLASAAET